MGLNPEAKCRAVAKQIRSPYTKAMPAIQSPGMDQE